MYIAAIIQVPRSSHNIISCRTPVCACAPVPRAVWDTLVGLLLLWGCARSTHLCKDAACLADSTNEQTTDCCERIYDKFTGPLVLTNRFSNYLSLVSFYLDICFPDVAPTKSFQAGRLLAHFHSQLFSICTDFSCFSLCFLNHPSCCDIKGLW